MSRATKILFSIPRTIWFNFRYLPLKYAFKLPVWIANNVRIKELHRGSIILNGKVCVGLIRIGYHEADGVDVYNVKTILNVAKFGRLIFKQDAHIGQGAIIRINPNGELILGRHFAISGTTTIIASKSIHFGDEVQLSWASLIMDNDAHRILDDKNNWINPPKEIRVGNNVWIAANTTVMKGTILPNDTIVATNSLVNRQFDEENTIIGGQPAKVLKHFHKFII